MNYFFKIGLLTATFASFFCIMCEKKQHKIYGTGTFEAQEVTVSAQASGLIIDMPIQEGQPIKKAALIAQLDTEKQQLTKEQLEAGLEEVDLNISIAQKQIEQAQIQYDIMKRNYERFKKLLEEKSTSELSAENQETKFEMAEKSFKSTQIAYRAALAKKKQLEAQLKLVNRQLEDATVTSPLDGTILRKLRQSGELAMMGTALVEIADLSEMELRIYISQNELGLLKPGDQLSIQIDSHPDSVFKGTVSWISPKAEFTPKNVQTKKARANLVYAVKLTVPNPEGILKIGMPADVFMD